MPENAPDPATDNNPDPAASTQMFQAFVDRYEPGGSGESRTPVIVVGAGLVALVIVVALVWLVLRG